MKILVHDFVGHAFQAQLSRQLAVRGHDVIHAFTSDFPGPKGDVEGSGVDGPVPRFVNVPLARSFNNYAPAKRLIQHQAYASRLIELIEREKPDVVLSGNTPIDIQWRLRRFASRRGIRFVHWVQDIYSLAIRYFLSKRFGAPGRFGSRLFMALEAHVTSRSDAVVVIAEEFADFMVSNWRIPRQDIIVIENWAPLDEMTPVPADRDTWRQRYAPDGRPLFVYTGTMGIKHSPELIYELARAEPGSSVVVITEGAGRRYLEGQPRLPNLSLLDYRPFAELPSILSAADVLVATLEAEAGAFAVPSKVLTYLCAGKPVLLSAPNQNLASKIVTRSGGGIAVEPGRPERWLDSARKLASEPALRLTLGRAARHYAEHTFDIHAITDRFERALQVVGPIPDRPGLRVDAELESR